MAALHRAVALKQIYVVAMGVSKHLNLNMPWTLGILFDQYVVIAKATYRFTLTGCQGRVKIFRLVDGAHAFATAACAGLNQHRVAHAVGFAFQQSRRLVSTVVAGYQRYTGFFHQLFGLGFQTHRLDG